MSANKKVQLKPISKGRQDFSAGADCQTILVTQFKTDTMGSGQRDVSIYKRHILGMYEPAEGLSVLELSDGQKLYVGLPISQVRERLDTWESEIDFRDVTGPDAIFGFEHARLKEKFNLMAVSKHLEDNDNLVILAYGLRDQDAKSGVPIAFTEADFYDVGEADIIFTKMRNWEEYRSEWNMSLTYGPFIKMSKADFIDAIQNAREAGQKFVNLLDQTRPAGQDTRDEILKVPTTSPWLAKLNKK